MTKYYNQDVDIYDADLYSINGEGYFIPGYPIMNVIGFIIFGMLGVYVLKFLKNRIEQ